MKQLIPAPWSLSGEGLILLYRFPNAFVRQHGSLQPYQQENRRLNVGAVMFINYTDSNIGPYQELLFIPGLFHIGGRLSFSISRIFVSTYSSMQNGRFNWGIPKELAEFEFHKQVDGTLSCKAISGQQAFFEARVKPGSLSFPFSSKLLPFSRIIQQRQEELLLTSPEASGKMRPARLLKATAEASYFPPLQQLKPLACLYLPAFRMKFPAAIKISP